LLKVINDAVSEIKELFYQSKQLSNASCKGKYMSLVYLNILFLIVYIIPIFYSIIIVGGSFFYGPIDLLGLLFSIPFIFFVFWIKTKVYPVMKDNFLDRNSLTK
jgi:hypothetical protein